MMGAKVSGRLQAFAPVVGEKPRVLVLGTMPSVRSLADAQYYAHPRNAFWPIMCHLFHQPAGDYPQRCQMLRDHHIALWDVLYSCVRPGSADSDIREEIPNDFDSFLQAHPTVRVVVFNGKGAQRLWKKHVFLTRPMPTLCFAATSPAYTLPFEQKLDGWRPLLELLREPRRQDE